MSQLGELAQVLSTVWTPTTVVFALVAGLALGYLLLGYLARLPAYATAARPGQLARTVFGSAVLVFGVFYLGQIIAAVAVDDGWPRIVSRWLLSVLYAAGMALGLWLRVRQHFRARHLVAAAAAEAEVNGGPPA